MKRRAFLTTVSSLFGSLPFFARGAQVPTDSNGNYTLPSSYFVQNGDTVLPVQHNPPFEDIATALTNRLMKDGRTVMTGNLQMGANRITGAGAGRGNDDVATIRQVGRKAAFDTVADLLSDNSVGYASATVIVSPGDIIEAQGFRYEVAANGATDAHDETAGEVKLYEAGPFTTLERAIAYLNRVGELRDGENVETDAQSDFAKSAVYEWSGTGSKKNHNGVSIISPTVPLPSDQDSLWHYRNGIGETDPNGEGVFVVRPSSVPGRVKKNRTTNLIPNPLFRDGWNAWAELGNTSAATFVRPECNGADGGAVQDTNMRISVVGATATAAVATQFNKNINATKKYRLEVRGHLNKALSGSEIAGINVKNYRFFAAGETVLDQSLTASGPFFFQTVINEYGGSAPAWTKEDSAQVEVQFYIRGDSAVAPELRMRVQSVSLIEDEKALVPTGLTADGNQTGSHEAVRVGDDIFIVLHGYRRVVKMDKDLKRQAISSSLTERPHDIAYDGESLWVITQGGERVHKLDPADLSTLATYTINGNRQGFGIVYDVDEEILFLGVGDQLDGEISAILTLDPSDGSQAVLSTDVAALGNNLPVKVFDGSIWAADGNTNSVKRINKGTGATEATIAVGDDVGRVYGLGTNGRVLCVCGAFGVAQIDPATNTVIRQWALDYVFGAQNVYIDDFGMAYACGQVMDTNTGESWPIVTERYNDSDWKWVHPVTDTKFVYGSITQPWVGSFEVSNY